MCTSPNHDAPSLIGAFDTNAFHGRARAGLQTFFPLERHHAVLHPGSGSPPPKVCKQDNQEEAERHLRPRLFVFLH